MSKILFTPYGTQLPLIKTAHENKHEVVSYGAFVKTIRDMDIPCQSVGEVDVDGGKIFSESQKIIHAVNSIRFSKNGKGGYLNDILNSGQVLSYIYPKLTETVSIVHLLDKIKPDLVVAHNDVELTTRGIASWAKKRGVPCLHVPHAVYVDIFNSPGCDIHDVFTSSHLVVAGEYQARWFSERGFNSPIAMTGLPQHDKMHNVRVNKQRAQNMLKLEHHLPVIMYASSWRQDTNLLGCHNGVEETYETFLEAMSQISGVQVLIKLHPNSSADHARWHINKANEHRVKCVISSQHKDIMLQASDVVFSYSPSNIIMSAAYIPHTRLMVTHGFEQDGVVLKVGEEPKPEDIISGVQNLLSVPVEDKNQFLTKYHGAFRDGKNHMRVYSYIESILKGEV